MEKILNNFFDSKVDMKELCIQPPITPKHNPKKIKLSDDEQLKRRLRKMENEHNNYITNYYEYYERIMGETPDNHYAVVYLLTFSSGIQYVGMSYDYGNNRYKGHKQLLSRKKIHYGGSRIDEAIKNGDILISVKILYKHIINNVFTEEEQAEIIKDIEMIENEYIQEYNTIENG